MRIKHVVLATLAVAACGSERATEPAGDSLGSVIEVDAGTEVRLSPGQVASVRGSDLRITFREVTEDSRCPIDALCVWQGDAVVQLGVTEGRMAWTPAALHLNTDPKSTTFRGHTITLLELAPSRNSEDSIRPSQYQVRLRVER